MESVEIEAKPNEVAPVTKHLHDFVYVLIFEREIVKIGKSSNPWERVNQLASGSSIRAVELQVFAVFDAGKAEQTLHEWFSEYRLNRDFSGEWFVIPKVAKADLRHDVEKFEINGVNFWPYCPHANKSCGLCDAIKGL